MPSNDDVLDWDDPNIDPRQRAQNFDVVKEIADIKDRLDDLENPEEN